VHRETRRVEKQREETKQPRRRSKTTAREAREREIWERRVLFEGSVAKERSRRSIIVGQQNVGQKKKKSESWEI
jgi:hypothetical protein